MTLNEKDIKTIKNIIEELRIYRNQDQEERTMVDDGLYSDEIELMNKLGITLE